MTLFLLGFLSGCGLGLVVAATILNVTERNMKPQKIIAGAVHIGFLAVGLFMAGIAVMADWLWDFERRHSAK